MATHEDEKHKDLHIEQVSSSFVDDKHDTPVHFEHSNTLVGDDVVKGERMIGGIAINTRMTAEERSTAMRLANELDPGPPVLSWTHIKFCLVALVVILNSGDSGKSGDRSPVSCKADLPGYDPTIMSSVNSMYQFHDYFGLGQATAGTGVVFVCHYDTDIWVPLTSDRVSTPLAQSLRSF